jgi:peptide deformylase
LDKLELQIYPAPVLDEKCRPIGEIDDEVREIAAEMLRIMYKSRGIGLAGPQVGVSRRIITLNLTGEKGSGDELCLIDPEILEAEGEETGEEGCLSFPGIRAKVKRAAKIRVAATTLGGERTEFEADGIFARALQHECDHLDGIVFITRMSRAQRFLIHGQLKDLQREYKKKRNK